MQKNMEKRSESEKIGIIKEFDKLGRLVIPKDLRERYALDNKVEIVATKQGVLIKSPEYVLVKIEKENPTMKKALVFVLALSMLRGSGITTNKRA